MNENIIKTLIQLKIRYFGSKFFSIKNWVALNSIELPEGVGIDDIAGWAEEKQLYLAKEKVELNGIKTAYEQMIIDRLDSAAAIQEKIMYSLSQIQDNKDLETITKTMEKVAKLQDEAMNILKVDAYRSNLYEMNKTSTEDLISETLKVGE